MKRKIVALAAACLCVPLCAPAQSSIDQKIDSLQQQIQELKAELARLRAASPPPATQAAAPAAAAAASPARSPTSLFGYGEFNYNRFRDGERTSRADLRRFVLGFGHRFNERLAFRSEVELEHAVASAGDRGEVEVEQAYLDYQVNDSLNVKGGLFLIPLGILNETHEPPTYYGVERNEVETRIIPTTWRELGVGVHGLLGQRLSYDAGITTGFNIGKLDDPAFGIRSAHQEGQLADARDLSYYGALNYRSPGLLLGGGLFTGNTGQNGQSNALLKGVAANLTLWDVHAKYTGGGWDLQALYAAGRIGDADRVNAAILASATTPFAAPRSLTGWYGQAAYHLWRRGDFDFAPFVRFERYEIRQQEDLANGLLQDPNNLERVRTIGFNFRVHPQVVIKSDYQRYSTDRSKDRFNIGLGYMF
ncbi:MAG TPA: porin [Burkholderiales bacterium]|jgi:outer membrane murein-binding lipoprotein Lpp|nr:porin [Burkholderiales bacterium]